MPVGDALNSVQPQKTAIEGFGGVQIGCVKRRFQYGVGGRGGWQV